MKKERYLLTMVDFHGDKVEGERPMRIHAEPDDEMLERIFGELTGLSPVMRDGVTENPAFVPYIPGRGDRYAVRLEWDEYFDYTNSAGEDIHGVCGMFYRQDIDEYYYYIEVLDRIAEHPKFQLGKLLQYGSEENCVDLE